MDIGKVTLYVLLMLFGLFLFVIVQQYMIGLNTSTWTFRGHAEVADMLPIIPYLLLLSLFLVPIYVILTETKGQ